ncbi:substrate-binding domain-containing protein [Saccharothrix algeriensis]|uniref:Extracellular solute-binding protein n=1 Tax=Saccharothrix algeriensis TaxID=173560 RepID=A0ABS2S4D6_9PSEU|nr:substrate-binding domain-containing protein [Saccharothrix algeriensis]MBM7810825.1 hypothetical protein [Saccharothrix algeriensis]
MDVSGFGARALSQQQAVRHGLYEALRAAFAECGVEWTDDWDGTYHEDRGDGLFVLVPADVPNSRVVSTLLHELVGQLRRHNAVSAPGARIRLRAAITAGEVLNDGNGVMGEGLVLAFRLLESAPLRAELEQRPGVLALVVSDRFYRDVVRQDPGCDPDSYRAVAVEVKEVRGTAWICRPDHPGEARPAPARWRPPRLPRPRWSASVLAVLLAVPLAGDVLLAAPAPVPPCPDPVQLNVLVSAEKAEVVGGLAADFEAGSRAFGGSGCKQVDVHVAVGASAAAAVAVLGRGWPDGDLVAMGPEPHVWLPDTGWEVQEVRRALADGGRTDVELDEAGPIAYSPLVLGVPAARAAREPAFRWRDVAAFRPLAVIDADATGAGLAAAVALARAQLGVTDVDRAALRGPGAARRLRDAALLTAPSGAEVCPAADRAVLASEKAVRDLGCLAPLYPVDGTLHLDHPFVAVHRVNLPRNARRDRVVGLFLAHVRSPESQGALRRAGFRDRGGVAESHDGIRPARRPRLPVEADTDAVRAAWRAANRTTRVVLAVDGSERATRLADRLAERVAPRGEVLRLDFAPADLAGVVERAVREHGADQPVVVLSGDVRPAGPGAGPAAPVTVLGVGPAAGACAEGSQLGAFRAAYRGDCYEEPDADRALDLVAGGLWGPDG